jgi:hypothetical protein
VTERLLDEIGFDAPNRSRQTVKTDAAMVHARIGELANDEAPSRYVLKRRGAAPIPCESLPPVDSSVPGFIGGRSSPLSGAAGSGRPRGPWHRQ